MLHYYPLKIVSSSKLKFFKKVKFTVYKIDLNIDRIIMYVYV